MRSFRIALAQINTTVGDLDGNTQKILGRMAEARALGVDLVAFPELSIPGYPPEDLLLKPSFIEANLEHLQQIVGRSEGIGAVVGFVDRKDDLYNAAAIICDGRLVGVYHKTYLPTYGVFDEDRYFGAGAETPIFALGEARIGVNVCEDIWHPWGPGAVQSYRGAEVIVNINGSPYHLGKRAARERMLATRAVDDIVIVAYTNLAGGQDELVFDGSSVIFDQRGEVVARGSQFEEDLVVADLDLDGVFRTRLHDPRRRKERRVFEALRGAPQLIEEPPLPPRPVPQLPVRSPRIYEPGSFAEIYTALVLGTRDYTWKNRFARVIIGLSGGIDSSLTATIAVDALGPENVVGVFMPSVYSSVASREDAEQLAGNLGIEFQVISIDSPFQAMLKTLSDAFQGTKPNVTEENLQARLRGNILMALSNKFGYLVLTTGNKSEMAVGYATLYGDMAGGFAVLKDVPKTMVYGLCQYRNQLDPAPVMSERILTKEPSAELRPGQRDVDSLPPYGILDPIMRAYVEEDRSFEEIVGLGFDPETVKRVISMIDRSEYKRRQAPPGIKITPRAFGRDRRLPITNWYKD